MFQFYSFYIFSTEIPKRGIKMILKARIYPFKFQGDISLFPFRRDAQFDTVADRSPRNFSLPHARLRTAIADRSAEPAQTADFRDLIIDEYHHRDPGNRPLLLCGASNRAVGKLQTR